MLPGCELVHRIDLVDKSVPALNLRSLVCLRKKNRLFGITLILISQKDR